MMRWLLVICLFLGGLLVPAHAQDGVLECPGGVVERLEIPGGPTLLLQSIPDLPCVSVAVCVPGGYRSDPTGKSGLARLFTMLANRATLHHKDGQLLAEFEGMGARTGALTTMDASVFWSTVPAAHVKETLTLEADRLQGLVADEGDLDRERELLAGELGARLSRPQEALERSLLGQLWPGLAVWPDPTQMAGIGIEDLRSYALSTLQSDRAIIAVVGGFAPQTVRETLTGLFSGGTAAPAAPRPSPPLAAPSASVTTLPGPPYLEWIYPLDVQAPTPALLALLDAALNDGTLAPVDPPGAEPGLTTRIDPSAHYYRVRWRLGEHAPALAEQILSDRIQALASNRLSPTEFESVRRRALSRFYRGLEDTAARAVELVVDQQLTGLTRVPRFVDELSRATPEQLREAAVFLKPEGAIRGRLQSGAGGQAGGGGKGAGTATSLPFKRHELENGITVLIQTVPDLPTVSIHGYLMGGALLDPVERPGLTALAAGLLGHGTTSRPGDKFAAEVQQMGLELGFTPGRQAVQIEGWSPTYGLKGWCALLADALRNPQSGPELFSQVQSQALAKLRAENPEQKAMNTFLKLCYPADHPYGRSAQGTAESVAQADFAQASNQLKRMARPDRLVLAFSGDVSEAEVLAALRPGLTSWYVDTPPPLLSQAAVTPTQGTRVDLEGRGAYALVLMGHPGPARRDADYYAFNLLNQILGGNPVTSRLATRIRDQQRLGPIAQSRLLSTAGATPWAITMRVRPAEVDKAIKLAREELERLRTTAPDQAEIENAVSALEGKLQVAQSSPEGRAELLSNLEFHRLSDSYLNGFAGLYRQITAKDLLETARKRFRPDDLVIVVVKPSGAGSAAPSRE